MLLLIVCQGVDISSELPSSTSPRSLPHAATQIASSILANMHQTQVSIEGLVVIAEKQAESRRPTPISRLPRDNGGRAREPMQSQRNRHRSVPSFDIDPNLITISGSTPSAYIDGLLGVEDALAPSKVPHSDTSSMLSIGDALSRPAPEPKTPAARLPATPEADRVSTDTAVPIPVPLSTSTSLNTSGSAARPATPESDDGKSSYSMPYCTDLFTLLQNSLDQTPRLRLSPRRILRRFSARMHQILKSHHGTYDHRTGKRISSSPQTGVYAAVLWKPW